MIGYCYGGVLTLLLAAAHPELPINAMMAMATPCDYHEMGFMSNMFREHRLDPNDVVDEMAWSLLARSTRAFRR